MNREWEQVRGTGLIWVPSPVLGEMEREGDRTALDETGGVLMGYWVRPPTIPTDAGEVVITAVSGPGPCAEHHASSFMPDHEYQEREIATMYAASGRRSTYLGDWHTHPEGPEQLSARDEATLRRIAREPSARASNPIMLILVGGRLWAPHAWVARVDPQRRWWQHRLTTLRLTVRVGGGGWARRRVPLMGNTTQRPGPTHQVPSHANESRGLNGSDTTVLLLD